MMPEALRSICLRAYFRTSYWLGLYSEKYPVLLIPSFPGRLWATNTLESKLIVCILGIKGSIVAKFLVFVVWKGFFTLIGGDFCNCIGFWSDSKSDLGSTFWVRSKARFSFDIMSFFYWKLKKYSLPNHRLWFCSLTLKGRSIARQTFRK